MVGGETNPDIEFGPGRIVPAYHAYATLAYTEIPPPRVIAVSGTFRANVSIDGTFDAKTITGTFDGTEDVPGTM